MKVDQDNERERQKNQNELDLQELTRNIELEQKEYDNIQLKAENDIKEEMIKGQAEGMIELQGVKTFLENLGDAVSEEQERIDLYKLQELNKGRTLDIENMKN